MPRGVRIKLLVVLGSFVACLVAWSLSTQRVAAELRFHPLLGPPLIHAGGDRGGLYPPWAWIGWAARFHHRVPSRVFIPAIELTGCTSLAAALALGIVLYPRRKASGAHGSARWAERHDLKKAGLLRNRGIVLGQTDDAITRRSPDGALQVIREGDLITHDGPEHALVVAPTRSGKGISIVKPTLFSWKGSALIVDIKGELWEGTAGYRRRFSHCLKFEPCSRTTVRLNPMLEVRRGEREVGDVENIADILVDPSGTKEERSHWDKTAASLLVGAMLHVLYAEEEKSLPSVARLLCDPRRSIVETLEIMLRTNHLGDRPHPRVESAARDMLNKEDREQSSVLSTARTFLTVFEDRLIANAVSQSDFCIDDLMNAEHPVSLYISVAPGDLSRAKPLLRLILNQIGRRLTERLGVYKHPLLFLLDEFAALGRMEFFETNLRFMAGYGIRCMPIVTSLDELTKAYGEHNSIIDNCHIRVCYAANKDYTARRISDLLGQATHLKKARTTRRFFGPPYRETEQEHPRPLLTPGEILQLPFEESLLFVGGMPPYRAKKIAYYADERFRHCEAFAAPKDPGSQAAELPPPRGHDWLDILCTQHVPAQKKDRQAHLQDETSVFGAGAQVLSFAGNPHPGNGEPYDNEDQPEDGVAP
jgi:type IV secretion system protein VirD4